MEKQIGELEALLIRALCLENNDAQMRFRMLGALKQARTRRFRHLSGACRSTVDVPRDERRGFPLNLKAKDVWLYVMSAGLVASLIGVAVLALNLSSLRADLTAANERAEEAENRTAEAEEETEEAEEETEDVLEDLEATEEQLRIVEKSLRNARAASPGPTGDLAEQLANGTAVPIGGLSVSLPGRDGAK